MKKEIDDLNKVQVMFIPDIKKAPITTSVQVEHDLKYSFLKKLKNSNIITKVIFEN